MSRQQISQHYSRLLSRWPADRLRPAERHFQRLLQKRIQEAPAGERDESREVNAAYLLLDNSLRKRYPLSESFMRPASKPEHYTALEQELDEAPDRTWLNGWIKRMKNLVRFQATDQIAFANSNSRLDNNPMTAISTSPASLAGLSPMIVPREKPYNIDLSQLAGRFENKRTPDISPKPPTSTSHSGQVNTRLTPEVSPQTYVPIDETAIFYSGKDFTPSDSAAITRVTSMSPEEALKAELDLSKDGSNQYDCFGKRYNYGNSFADRRCAFSALKSNLDLPLLNKKLVTLSAAGAESSEPHPRNVAVPKPTAQEWVSDIDCVSGIVSMMLADDDRGVAHL